MEEEFEVVIVRSYETRIRVSGASAAAVRKQITAYGILEATSDYPHIGEVLTVERIKSIAPINGKPRQQKAEPQIEADPWLEGITNRKP